MMLMGVHGSAEHDPICCCVLDAGRQRPRDAGARPRPGCAIPVHTPAADQDTAIVVVAELSDDSRRGAAGAGPATIAPGSLPRHATARPVGFAINTDRSDAPRTDDFRAVFTGGD